jgi:acyl-[acyl-carrier-protein]-phospholipid O-acyltransferase/long-chain-fatty-acid--[acyl-carrier-protein] ligase
MNDQHKPDSLPPLLVDRAFCGMSVTQFLGAFNDNLFKQLLLLLATPTAAQVAAGAARDRQSEAMMVFAGSILLFSGFAGWLSDRVSKKSIIVACKAAEVLIMLLGLVGFLNYGAVGFGGMLVVLALMGVHTAMFGPPKYGILPEMIRDRDLPQANGIFLMFTFVAIIFGTVLAGKLGADVSTAWRGSLACIGIAVMGVVTALMVRRTPPANPTMPLRFWDFLAPPELLRIVWRDKELLAALIVTSTFWMLGGMVQQTVNALGKTQMGLDDASTSVLAAMLGVGIPVGCLLGGRLSAGRIDPRVVLGGAAGVVVGLLLMSLRGGDHRHLLGFYGSIPVLMLTGVATGAFIVPVQVSLQTLPPAEEKGRVIGLMNQCNWVGILLGAVLYDHGLSLLERANQPRNTMFAVTAAMMLLVVLFYRPKARDLAG